MEIIHSRRRRMSKPSSLRIDATLNDQIEALSRRYPLFTKTTIIESALALYIAAVHKANGQVNAHCLPDLPEVEAIIKAA